MSIPFTTQPLMYVSTLLLIAFIGLLAWVTRTYLFDDFDHATYDKIPGPKTWPIFGNANIFRIPLYQFRDMYNGLFDQYGPIVRIKMGKFPYILIKEAEDVEKILGNSKHITKGRDYQWLYPVIGKGLLTSKGEKWHSRRKLLTPAFHFNILEDFLLTMNEHSNVLINILDKYASTNQTVDVFPIMGLVTLDIICDAAMGRNVEALTNSSSSYVGAIKNMAKCVVNRMVNPSMWPDALYYNIFSESKIFRNAIDQIHNFTQTVITERKRDFEEIRSFEMEDRKNKRLVFLDLLLAASQGGRIISDQEIREEVDTFMFEGHDTTAAALSFTLYNLAKHENAQANVIEELNEIFQGDQIRPIQSQDLAKMKYLECCIKETLRMFPSVPFISRVIKEPISIQNYTVPKGTNISIMIWNSSLNPKVFPDPKKFDPSRFTSEESRQRHPYSYLPFSAGPRNCIGQKFAMMELKVVLAYILRHFKVSTDMKEMLINPELVIKPNNGVPIKFKRH